MTYFAKDTFDVAKQSIDIDNTILKNTCLGWYNNV